MSQQEFMHNNHFTPNTLARDVAPMKWNCEKGTKLALWKVKTSIHDFHGFFMENQYANFSIHDLGSKSVWDVLWEIMDTR